MLKGKIKSHIKSDKYEFADKNGDVIVVEIDNNKWGNVTANEDTPLRIRGEVDKELTKTKIDVDSVEVVKQVKLFFCIQVLSVFNRKRIKITS